jgi:energy-coupling factor transporter ATP-binding protein EcfA2
VAEITDQVIDFYNKLFERIFFEPFSHRITDRRRRDAVHFQVLEAAGAASQSLERFLISQRHTEPEVECVLNNLASISADLTLEQVANPYVVPEKLVDDILSLPAASAALQAVTAAEQETVFRVGLHSVVQALMQIGPVMSEWQNIGFPSTFELSRRVVARLNEISAQLEELAKSGSEAADERYELQYRDYLSQRFYRVEAGTVRMTTNVSIDLRELFVMPNVLERQPSTEKTSEAAESPELMPLSKARQILGAFGRGEPRSQPAAGTPALTQVKQQSRNVIVGAPGSGKSTFLEWFQLKIASAEEVFVLAEQQAIPLLLRVRQLDPDHLPDGSELIAKAAESRDFAALMPPGWLDRQMSRGAVVFMLDGLDEVEPDIRDNRILPWFTRFCRKYSKCAFIVSSRPVGYPAGMLRKLSFSECELLDFTADQTAEYARHWCTAIRLARNEVLAEAKREGIADGDRIVSSFKGNPYITSLARNPLMLSAICLVNYFEGGQLPKDRAVLYKLCVEGLLHNWDQRRGILSEFSFEEKLRVSKEVAIRMQMQDRAEYDLTAVHDVFCAVLKSSDRAESLLEHIRYRTGLLLERRTRIFAMAHLTFQEYLAARAVYEGNLAGVSAEQIVREHDDPRWREVIVLYCGLAPARAAKPVIEALITEPNVSAGLLAEAFLSSGPELAEDKELGQRVMFAVAKAKHNWSDVPLNRFAVEEFAPIANQVLGTSGQGVRHAYQWLFEHPASIDFARIVQRLGNAPELDANDLGELNLVAHLWGSDEILTQVVKDRRLYLLPGAKSREPQAMDLLRALNARSADPGPGVDAAYFQVLGALLSLQHLKGMRFFRGDNGPSRPGWQRIRPLCKALAERIGFKSPENRRDFAEWIESIDRKHSFDAKGPRQRQPRPRPKKPKKKKP